MSTFAPTTAEAKVQNREISWLALLTRVDPLFQRDKHLVVEYDFANYGGGTKGGRIFYGDPDHRGAYGP